MFIVLILFFLTMLLGYVYPVFFKDFILKFIQELAEKTAGMDFLELYGYILANNIKTAFLGMIFGIIFGILPVAFTLLNGYVLGFVSAMSVNLVGKSILLRLLPHGVFEFPALVISFGLGIKLASYIFARNPRRQFFYDLKESLRVFIFVIIPLLTIAAIIEAWLIIALG